MFRSMFSTPYLARVNVLLERNSLLLVVVNSSSIQFSVHVHLVAVPASFLSFRCGNYDILKICTSSASAIQKFSLIRLFYGLVPFN